jgi:prepilin-type N-terminal cleavage/methylation domain-containing protein
MGNNKGLTIIESLVCLVIIGIGFIAVTQLTGFAISSMDRSIETNKSNFYSEMIVEDMISNPQNISYYDNFNEVCSMNTTGGSNLHDKQKDKWRLKLMQKDFLKINGNAKQPICSKEDIKKTFINSNADRTTGKINYFNNKGKRKKYLGVVIK